MKTIFNRSVSLVAGALLSLAATPVLAGEANDNVVFLARGGGDDLPPLSPGQKQLFLRAVADDGDKTGSKDATWLGVGVEESPEPLSAQLDLKPGQGLVVTYVATNSPAATAGLQKNDVLVELDGQMLVDPVQLRKLVQMHADGDNVNMDYYRAGKKQTVSVKLAKRTFTGAELGELPNHIPNLWAQSQKLADIRRLDNGKIELEIQGAMDQARKALSDAQQSLHGPDGVNHRLELIHKQLGNLADGGVRLDKNATVVVKNDGGAVRTIVKKDDTGTYVIVADPAKHLTAHDADNKLLFDGTIESAEQQAKVPPDVWKKVEPMLDQLDHDGNNHPKKVPPMNLESE